MTYFSFYSKIPNPEALKRAGSVTYPIGVGQHQKHMISLSMAVSGWHASGTEKRHRSSAFWTTRNGQSFAVVSWGKWSPSEEWDLLSSWCHVEGVMLASELLSLTPVWVTGSSPVSLLLWGGKGWLASVLSAACIYLLQLFYVSLWGQTLEGIPFKEQKGACLALLSILKRWSKLKYPLQFC